MIKHAVAVAGAIITILGATLLSWIDPDIGFELRGFEFTWGQATILFAVLIIAFRAAAVMKRRFQLYNFIDIIISGIAVILLLAVTIDLRSVLELDENVELALGAGYYLTLLGLFVVLGNAIAGFMMQGKISPDSSFLKVALLWQGEKIKEHFFTEGTDILIGSDVHKNDFIIPSENLPSKSFPIFRINPKGVYHTALRKDMDGTVRIDNVTSEIKDFVQKHTWNISGENYVPLAVGDWGVFKFDDLSLFFQSVKPDEKMPRKGVFTLDKNMLSAFALSAVLAFSLIITATIFWEEDISWEKKQDIRKLLKMDVQIAEEKEEELIELGEEEDTVGKKAEGEEGKFGDPDEDPKIESKVPKRDGKMVSQIDPKKIGLNDLLSTNKLGKSAISSILSDDSGFTNKLAVAMSGTGTELVIGHGAGGMGFKGTGPGGGGTSGYGRIHGLGKIDTGGGMGMKAGLGAKGKRQVAQISLGQGSSTGFCNKNNIRTVVLRRAGAIRACYEAQLQIHAELAGKITARWTINLEGDVEAETILPGSTLQDANVENCILRTIHRMKFDKPEGGICVVQWPFVFNPG
jgi:hypothetical protein